MIFLDGVYTGSQSGSLRFQRVKAPCAQELQALAHTLALRTVRYLEKQGALVQDDDEVQLMSEGFDENPLSELLSDAEL